MILIVVTIALAVAPLDASLIRSDGGCKVSINTDLSDPQPLVLVKIGNQVDFLNPTDSSGTLSFEAKEEFRLACLGSGNYLVGVGNNNIQDIAAYCVSGKTFLVNSEEHQFSQLVCRTKNLSVIRKTGKKCLGSHSQVEIGFDFGNEFLRTIEACRDDNLYHTYYAMTNMTKNIGGSQTGYPRPSWHQASEFWGLYSMETQYSRSVQKATVSHILNSANLGEQYVSSSSNYYFARGHIAAKADFVYGSAQSSTFWYVNSAPQWQTFNGQNWMYLESNVRSFASSAQLDLEVYTGTHGVMTLPDVDNVEQPIYFYASGNDRALPIPLYFWKIIYDPISKMGTAFVGLNNPYIKSLTSDYYICEDISGKISWLTWYPTTISKGISYACTIDDLRKAVPTVPQLTVIDILK